MSEIVRLIESWADSPRPMRVIHRHYGTDTTARAMLALAEEVEEAMGDPSNWFVRDKNGNRVHVGDTVIFKGVRHEVRAFEGSGYVILGDASGPLWASAKRIKVVDE